MGAQTKTRKYNIESRVAKEYGITHKQVKEILELFFEVLKEECSVLEEDEQIAYTWLKLICKKNADRMVVPGMIGYREEVGTYLAKGKTVIKAKILPSFYADPKKGLESNWGS